MLIDPIVSMSPRNVIRVKSAINRRKRVNYALSTAEQTMPLTSREVNPPNSGQHHTLLASDQSTYRGQTRNIHSLDF